MMTTQSYLTIPSVPNDFLLALTSSSCSADEWTSIFSQYGDIVAVNQKKKLFAVSGVEEINHILKDKNDAYDKDFMLYERMKFFLGDGVLTRTGPSWRNRRKLLQPHFAPQAMPALTAIAVEETKKLIVRWQHYAKQHQAFDLNQELLVLMLKISSQALFHCSLSDSKARFLMNAYEKEHRQVRYAMSMNPLVPSIAQWRARIAHFQINRVVKQILRDRPKESSGDLLDTLWAAGACPMAALSLQDMNEEIRSFLGTGHETTASSLTWTMINLLQHPEHIEKLQHELRDVLQKRDLVYEDLPALTWAKMIFQEGLRLYPAIWMTGRHLTKPDILSGYQMPEGATIAICLYALHRNQRYWDDPDRFDPYRFTPEAIAARNKHAYLPFGAGAHTCIAQSFAMIQGSVVLAMLMQHFEFELLSTDFSHELLFTIRPKYPIFIRVKER